MNASADDAARFAVYRPDGNRMRRTLVDGIDVGERMRRVADGLDPGTLGRVRARLGISIERLGELIGLSVVRPDGTVAVGREVDLVFGELVNARPSGPGDDDGEPGLPGAGAHSLDPVPLPAVPDGHGLMLVHASADRSSVTHGIDASGRVHGAPADRLDVLERITEHALAVFGGEDTARRWFASTIRALGDRRPVDCLDSAAGRELVLDTLGAIEHGHVMVVRLLSGVPQRLRRRALRRRRGHVPCRAMACAGCVGDPRLVRVDHRDARGLRERRARGVRRRQVVAEISGEPVAGLGADDRPPDRDRLPRPVSPQRIDGDRLERAASLARHVPATVQRPPPRNVLVNSLHPDAHRIRVESRRVPALDAHLPDRLS